MSTVQERPLTPDETAEFEAHATQGMNNLGAENGSSPAATVGLVNAFVDKWQRGGFAPRRKLFGPKPAMPDSADVALGLGAVWGNQIVSKFGWEWTCLRHEGKDLYCVATKDRGWVILPTYFLKACLDNPQVDCTAMLSFNMIDAGSIPDNPPRTYGNLMNGVHRLIPN